MPKVKVRIPEVTYIMWMDFCGYGISPEEVQEVHDRIYNKANILLEDGSMFGEEGLQEHPFINGFSYSLKAPFPYKMKAIEIKCCFIQLTNWYPQILWLFFQMLLLLSVLAMEYKFFDVQFFLYYSVK